MAVITYTLTLDVTAAEAGNGRFTTGVWTNTNGSSGDDSQPIPANAGDAITFVIQAGPNQNFPVQNYLLAITFARARRQPNAGARSTPFGGAANRPYAGLIQNFAPLAPTTSFTISSQGISNRGKFEFAVLFRTGNSPLDPGNPGNDYSRDPELDVTD